MKHSNTRDSITLILFAFGFLLFAMLTSCASTKGDGPCKVNRNFIGYGKR